MEYLADEWKVVRMGSVVNTKLNTDHPAIFDYSRSGNRSELLDIYLSAQCRFFLSCGTGLDAITSCCFRRPVLYVNFIPPICGPIMKPGSIFIPKKYWHTKEERYLNLSELLSTGIGRLLTPSALNPHDTIVLDDTPEEILAAAKEMKARLDGTWIETPEDKERQKLFWSHYLKASPSYKCVGLIGTEFLKENPSWLE